MPPWQPQTQVVAGLAAGVDPQFVLMRDIVRQKLIEYIRMKPMAADWQRRVPEVASRIEEILFRRHPNKTEYCNMAKGAIQSYLYFVLRFLTAHQNQQQQQSQQSSGQIASSPGYITQGASATSRMSYVTHNMDPSSSAGLVPQSATMGTSLPGTNTPDEHVNTTLSLGINPTQHDWSIESNNNNLIHLTLQPKLTEAHPVPPIKDLPRKPKFICPICKNELVDASSTICGHIFCQKCIEPSIQAQKKCPTYRRKLTMRSFHRIYLPMMDRTDPGILGARSIDTQTIVLNPF
ncbi:probable histone acetyltransferase HAC-like 1 [Triticum urartu]|uniref:probable histone acetyltransferase HAC-like 1 n=1 Tax=Triticum urartu TaxID=4572 RepID=UPI0020434F6B|nr:probable histone acetyltransferase HAC-like 1 [Triticum urartu]